MSYTTIGTVGIGVADIGMADRSIRPVKPVPVLLCGGRGTRLWPLSRRNNPKPLHKLSAELTLLQSTAIRIADPLCYGQPVICCDEENASAVSDQLAMIGFKDFDLILEPAARNTAAAVATATLHIANRDPAARLLILPCDHVIGNPDILDTAIDSALVAADLGYLTAFGVEPTEPHEGFGYIEAGARISPGCISRKINSFIEKPSRAVAETYLNRPGSYWNSGMFLFAATQLIEEFERQTPEVLSQCRRALNQARIDDNHFHLSEGEFVKTPALSIDVAIMENARKAAIVPTPLDWRDVGDWQALWTHSARDLEGNAVSGPVIARDCANTYLRSEGPLIAAAGLEDHVVVATDDAVLIARRDNAGDIRRLVEQAAHARHRAATRFPATRHVWGRSEIVFQSDGVRLMKVTIKPGARSRYWRHERRSETWVTVSGHGRMTLGARQIDLPAGQSAVVEPGITHGLANPGPDMLEMIGVQYGPFVEGDDIVVPDDAVPDQVVSDRTVSDRTVSDRAVSD